MALLSPTARVVPALTRRVRTAPAAWGYLATGLVATGVYFLLHGDAQSIFYEAVGFSAVVAIYVGHRPEPPGRPPPPVASLLARPPRASRR